jgi:hypothetical protein
MTSHPAVRRLGSACAALGIFSTALLFATTAMSAPPRSGAPAVLFVPATELIVGNYARAATRDWMGVYCTGMDTATPSCTARKAIAKVRRSMALGYDSLVPDVPSSTVTFQPAKPFFALFLPGLPEGDVPVAVVDPAKKVGRQLRHAAVLGGKTWELGYPDYDIGAMGPYATGQEPETERLNCRPGRIFEIRIDNGMRSVTWQRPLCDVEPNGLADGGAKPAWIGDLDGDGVPDVLLALPSHPQAAAYTLLLSSKPTQVIDFTSSDPNNPGC